MFTSNEINTLYLKTVEKNLKNPLYKSNIYHMMLYGSGLYDEMMKEEEKDDFYHYESKKKIVKKTIPEGTKNLLIDMKYNQPFELGDLPKSVKRLEFGDCSSFNQYFFEEKEGIEELIFNYDSKYDKEFLKNGLPKTLKKLQLPANYSKTIIKGALPESLKTLLFLQNIPNIEEGALPNGIEVIHFSTHVGVEYKEFKKPLTRLPSQLKELYLSLSYPFSLKGLLPEGLKILSIRGNHTFEEGELPDSLEYLNIPSKTNTMISKKIFPKNLKYLNIGCDPKYIEEIPDTVQYLSMNREWNDIKIPDSVEYLTLPILFNASLKDTLPKNLKGLVMNERISKKWKKGDLPETLRLLDISRCCKGWDEEVTNDDLPENLEYLYTGTRFMKDISHEIMYYHRLVNQFNLHVEYKNCTILIKTFEQRELEDFLEKMISRKKGYHRDLKDKARGITRIQSYLDGGYSVDDMLSFLGYP